MDFADHVNQTVNELHPFFYRLTNDAELTEEIGGYLRFQSWRCWREKRPKELRPLMITAGRRFYSNLRVQQVKTPNVDSASASVASPSWPDLCPEQRELRDCVRQAVLRLSGNHQEVIHLVYFCGLTSEEVATRLQKPLGTIKTWKRSALALLRILLAPLSRN